MDHGDQIVHSAVLPSTLSKMLCAIASAKSFCVGTLCTTCECFAWLSSEICMGVFPNGLVFHSTTFGVSGAGGNRSKSNDDIEGAWLSSRDGGVGVGVGVCVCICVVVVEVELGCEEAAIISSGVMLRDTLCEFTLCRGVIICGVSSAYRIPKGCWCSSDVPVPVAVPMLVVVAAMLSSFVVISPVSLNFTLDIDLERPVFSIVCCWWTVVCYAWLLKCMPISPLWMYMDKLFPPIRA